MTSFALNIVSIFSEVLVGVTYGLVWWRKRNTSKLEKHKSMTPLSSPAAEKMRSDVQDLEVVNEVVGC
jgi:hypothetical protein